LSWSSRLPLSFERRSTFNRRDKRGGTILPGLLAALLREPWRSWRSSRVRALLEDAQAALARGEPELARRSCNDAIADDPRNVVGHYLLGSIDAQAGLYEAARKRLEHCVALGARFPEVYIHLGNVYRLRGDLGRAAQTYRKAVDIDPLNALGHYNLALIAKQEGTAAEVLEHLEYAQTAPETKGEVIRLRTKTLIELGRYDEAVQSACRAVEQDASSHDAWIALGFAYQKVHEPHEALKCYERALAIRGGEGEFFNNYGIVLQDLGRVQESIDSYEAALKINPADSLARFHKSLINLLIGNYAIAWPDYETRLLSLEYPARPTRYARWHGESLQNKTIVAYGEQGLGDEIMFASCLPELIDAAGHCMIECSPKLRALFSRSFSDATVYQSGPERPVPAEIQERGVDFEVPLGSLPLHYRRSGSAFPHHDGYLKADPVRVEAWRAKVQDLGSGLKVGLSWRGGTYKTRNPIRSIGLERWMPVLRIPNMHFVSVQYTADAPADIAMLTASHGINITHWQDAIDDYDETAALVCALDLVLTVCTSVVHLAGALGQAVWVAAPFVPEWRYGLEGESMAWYPSARLFRQSEHGGWEDVIRRMSEHLSQYQIESATAC
jgi:tetratricopeptide (TPR) repeat protein